MALSQRPKRKPPADCRRWLLAIEFALAVTRYHIATHCAVAAVSRSQSRIGPDGCGYPRSGVFRRSKKCFKRNSFGPRPVQTNCQRAESILGSKQSVILKRPPGRTGLTLLTVRRQKFVSLSGCGRDKAVNSEGSVNQRVGEFLPVFEFRTRKSGLG